MTASQTLDVHAYAIASTFVGRAMQDDLELLVDLTRHTRSIMLELAVIVLIAIELLVALTELRFRAPH